MKSWRKVFSVLLIALLALTALSCTGGTQDPAATTSDAAPSYGDPNDPASHPIYKMLDKIELDGVYSPVMADRLSINKGLPTELVKGRNLTIAWCISSVRSPFFVNLLQGGKDKAEELGHTFLSSDANQVMDKQSADIDAYITMGVDALVINPIDQKGQIVDVEKAVAAGIPVFTTGTGFMPEVPHVTSLLANNFFGGWYSGIELAKAMGDKKVVGSAIVGRQGSPISEGRINGQICGFLYQRYQMMGKPFAMQEDAMMLGTEFYGTLREKGRASLEDAKLEIIGMNVGEFTVEGGLKAMEDLLTGNPGMNALFSDNDLMGEGAVLALEAQGKVPGQDVLIICSADGAKPAMELIKQGKILATGYQNPTQLSGEVIQLIHNIFIEGYDANNMPAITNSPLIAITKDNVDQFYDPNSDLPKKQPFQWKTIDEYNAEHAK